MKGTAEFKRLFEPIQIGTLTLRNRIVMPAMRTDFPTLDGYVTNQLKDYHEARAKGGVGLNITEFTCVQTPIGKGTLRQMAIDDDKFIPGLSDLAQVIHKHGGKTALQLHHAGSTAKSNLKDFQPVAPSAIARPGWKGPRELTIGEIQELVRCYARGAERAKKAGFDAVEIHGAHRYLVAQFLSPAWNKRKDAYGGDLRGRARFLLEIIQAIRDVVGPQFPFWCRINGAEFGIEGGSTIEDGRQLARMLEEAGLNAINISASSIQPIHASGWIVDGKPIPPTAHPPGLLVPLAESIKKVVKIPVIVVGSITPEVGERILAEGKVDLVAIGRGLLADPELPNKAGSGRLKDVRPCIRCLACRDKFHGGNKPLGCSVNAALGNEREFEVQPSQKPKKVMVVGGGPAGMECARVARERGHEVWLYEKESTLGGQLNIASTPPYKNMLTNFSDYLQGQLRKLGVVIELKKEVTRSLVDLKKPDVVIVATGIKPLVPEIPGIRKKNVVLAEDVLAGKADVGSKVTVIGGGMVGCETAEFLAEKGKAVTIVEMLEKMATNVGPQIRQLLLDRLAARGVRMLVETSCQEITDKGLAAVDKKGQKQEIDADTIVLAIGSKPNKELFEALKGAGPKVYIVGDSVEPRSITEAVAEGFKFGLTI